MSHLGLDDFSVKRIGFLSFSRGVCLFVGKSPEPDSLQLQELALCI